MKPYRQLTERHPVYEQMPEGWNEIKGALTAPVGYRWIYNCRPMFDNNYKKALLKI